MNVKSKEGVNPPIKNKGVIKLLNKLILNDLSMIEKNIIKIDLISNLNNSLLNNDNKDINDIIQESFENSLKAIYILRR